MLHENNTPLFWKSYPLVFYRMRDKVCYEKIEFTCSGPEDPIDILRQMQRSGLLPFYDLSDVRVLYWPTQTGINTEEKYDKSPYLRLCEFDPEPGRVFIIEEPKRAPRRRQRFRGCLYGCPTAATDTQPEALESLSVDVVAYD